MPSYSHRFCADIHAPAAALCVTETGVLATACIHTKLQDVFADLVGNLVGNHDAISDVVGCHGIRRSGHMQYTRPRTAD